MISVIVVKKYLLCCDHPLLQKYKQKPYDINQLQGMSQDENDSSEEEGFYKPSQIKVEEDPQEGSEPLLVQLDETEQANELINHSRPTDLLPRVLSTFHQLVQCHDEVNSWSTIPLQQLLPLKRQRIKKSRYMTLQQKYSSTDTYECVYSKFEGAQDCNTAYIFSLNQTADYNPKDYQIAQKSQQQSQFQSKFQSGNLLLAYKSLRSTGEEYDLILQNDTNTRGYNSWFFFSFMNGGSSKVKFNIVNLIKRHTLFEEGVRPVALSMKESAKGWHSIGSELDYQKSYVTRQILTNPPTSKNYYTLSFTVEFQHIDDTVYIAMNYPYTYTRMVNFIERLGVHRLDLTIQRSILCYSLSNNAVPLLRIRHEENDGKGKKIIVMGRQHPGETVGSYVLEGFLKKIVNQIDLLKEYELIAIPMVNPDGVIYGNFRTNLSGFDLNRQWQTPDRWMHPQIYSISKFINSLTGVTFVLDFHGHSKKYNSFIYACTGEPSYPFRVFPYIYGKTSNLFSIRDCTYSMTADKERTARIQIYRVIKRPQVFTLETSFFGYQNNSGRKYRFKMKDLVQIGEGALESLKTYLMRKKEMSVFQKEVKEKQYLFEQWAHQIRQDDIESQSNPSQDELTPVERKEKVIATREAKRSKGVSPSKKRSKKKREGSILNITKMKLATQEKSQTLFDREQRLPHKKYSTGPVIVVKKKQGSQRTIPLSQGKVKPKRVEKVISLISPPLPKPKPKTLTKSQAPSFYNPAHSEIKIKLQFEKLHQEQKKLEEIQASNEKIRTITSNLFNKPNYFSYFQQKMFKKEAQSSHNKTQSLQISSIKRQQTFSHGMDTLKKLISAEEEEKQTRWEQNRKYRDKLYMIRENRIISSTARLNQEAMKRNIEEQISNRTQALINCQKKMSEINIDDPLLRNQTESYALEYLNGQMRQTCSVKAPKFPSIKGEFPSIKGQKKRDYFNF